MDIKTENNVTFKQSFLRHLVDPIDMFFFGIVAIIIIKNSKESQRLGDLLGQTKVIKVWIKLLPLTVFLQAGLKFSSKILAINSIFSK